jgi:V/A-type H+-transporting ATPase subunit E
MIMAEELQGLLDRIQKDGVDRAEAEAAQITADAKARAKAIVAEAESQAKTLLERAAAESELFQKRSENAITQAARDVILSVGEAVTETFRAIVARQVDSAMKTEALRGFIQEAIRAYTQAKGATAIEVLISETEQESVTAYFMKAFAEAMKSGLTIRGNRSVISGFTVTLTDKGVQHDFTGEALTEAIGKLLRPQLAKIVSNALKNTGKNATK